MLAEAEGEIPRKYLWLSISVWPILKVRQSVWRLTRDHGRSFAQAKWHIASLPYEKSCSATEAPTYRQRKPVGLLS